MKSFFLLLSDVLSIITILLCLILKIPQIYRIIKSGGIAGLSLNGLLLELSSYTTTMMYNHCNKHALLSYLEYPIIIIQEYFLIGLVMHYKKFKLYAFLSLFLLYSLISLAFAFYIFPKYILTVLLPFTTPVGAASKIMQLWEIMSHKNANSVSITTWALSFFTNVTRIYTVFLDSADKYLLLNFSISSFLSLAVLLTAQYYQRKYPKEKVKI